MTDTVTGATSSPGARFREAIKAGNPLQVVGTINAYSAMMAEQIRSCGGADVQKEVEVTSGTVDGAWRPDDKAGSNGTV